MRLKDIMLYQDGGKIWPSLNTEQRKSYIYNAFLQKGYDPIQASAIVGNLQQENSTFGTTTKNKQGSGAVGIAQWLGSRKKELMSTHSDWYDIDKQIDFIDREVRGDKNAWTNNVGGKKAFFNTKDVEQATKIFRKDFERPGEKEANDQKRIANAYSLIGQSIPSNQIYAKTAQTQTEQEYTPQGDNIAFDFATYNENQRLLEEKLNQDQIAKNVEQENLMIQQALETKNKEREQMLSMIPQAEYVSTGVGQSKYNQLLSQPSNVMQSGGKVDYTKLPYDTKDIKNFYGNMIGSEWYNDRLENNGYEKGWFFQDDKVTSEDVAKKRANKVNETQVYDIDYLLKQHKNTQDTNGQSNFTALLDNIDSMGSHYNGKNIYFENKIQPNNEKAHPRTVITHEFGHAETRGYPLSDYEADLLRSKIQDNGNRSDHDFSPNERKSDINTIRYNLYKSGIFDPKTGKYKTKSGKFEKNLLEKTKTDFSTKRLRELYKDDDLVMLLNTIAHNDTEGEELFMAQKGGKTQYPEMDANAPFRLKREFLDVLNYEKEYLDSPKLKERAQKAGYNGESYGEYVGDKLNKLSLRIDNDPNSNTNGAYYNPDNQSVNFNSNEDSFDTMPHEIGHTFENTKLNDFINKRNRFIPTTYLSHIRTEEKLKNEDFYSGEGHELDPGETSADVHAVRYELSKLGKSGYDGRYGNFTNEAYNDMVEIALKDPLSASARILNKIGSNKNQYKIKQVKNNSENIKTEKQQKDHDKSLEKLYEDRGRESKKYIFDIMNSVVMSPNENKVIQAQKGGKIINDKVVDERDIKSFYNQMITSPWYKQRLIENDYGLKDPYDSLEAIGNIFDSSERDITIDQIINSRNKNVQSTIVDYDHDYGRTTYARDIPTLNKAIFISPSQLDNLKVHPRTALSHEYGHSEIDKYSQKEFYPKSSFDPSLTWTEKKIYYDNQKTPKTTSGKYVLDPEESKGDVNSIRYNLYKDKSFNPKTGKYKTEDGLFNLEMINKLKNDKSLKRMIDAYGEEGLIEVMNKVAQNDFQNKKTQQAKKGGKIKSK